MHHPNSPVSPNIDSEMERRTFLKVGAGVAAGAVVLGVLEKLRRDTFGPLGQLEKKTQGDIDVFAAEYLRTGDPKGAADLFPKVEWMHYLQSTKAPVAPTETFIQKTYNPFMAKVTDEFAKRVKHPAKEEFGTPTVARIASLKVILHSQLPQDMSYEGSQNSIVDPLLNHTLQCRSGTKLLLLAMLKNISGLLQPGERLVQINVDTHTLAGLVTADGQVIGFEMVKSGKGVTDFGHITKPLVPMQVVDAEHAMAEDAIGQHPFKNKSMLADTSPKTSGGGFRIPGTRTHTDQHGFGTKEVPAGKHPIDSMDYVPAQPSGERGAGAYDSFDPVQANAAVLKNLTRDEQIVVRRYMQHTSFFVHCFNRHVAILEKIEQNPAMGEAEENAILEEANALVKAEMLPYIQKNGVAADHREAHRILERHQLHLNFDVSSITGQMMNNTEAAHHIWRKAQRK